MLKNLLGLGVFVMALQLTTTAYSVNYKLLDLEADSYTSKIWSGASVPKNKIKESLGFLYDTDTVDTKYSQISNFKKFYEKVTNQVKDQKFLQFAEECRLLQEENSDVTTKIAVHLLLEKVFEKYNKALTKVERFKSLQEQIPTSESFGKGNILDTFLNADKNIKVNQ